MQSRPLSVYLAAAPSDSRLAEAIARSLAARGLLPCLSLTPRRGTPCGCPPALAPSPPGLLSRPFRDALRRAAAILVLVGHERRPTDAQRCERQAILEEVWSGSGKLLVPVLLGRAALPSYLRSVHPEGVPIAVYRLKRPRTGRLHAAMDDLAAVLRGEADLASVGERLDTTAEDRLQRLQALAEARQIAQSLPW